MAIVNVTTVLTEETTTAPVAPVIYVRQSWLHDWQLEPRLTCVRVSFNSGAKDSEAILRAHYGDIQPAGFADYGQFSPPVFERFFVKITFSTLPSGSREFVGIIVASQDTRGGDSGSNSYGDYSYVAYGLEWCLRRVQVTESVAIRPAVLEGAPITSYAVRRGLVFNGGASRGGSDLDIRYANRSSVVGPRGVYGYAHALKDAEEWNAAQIVNYLATYHQPWSVGDLSWSLDPLYEDLLEWHKPRGIHTHGQTIRQIIDAVIDRRRGLTYDFYVSGDELLLRVFSVFSDPITLPSTVVVPEASRELAVDMGTRRRSDVTYWNDQSSKYEQVIVQGAPRTTTMTLTPGVLTYSSAAGTTLCLKDDWTDDQMADYIWGARSNGSYADWDLATQEEANESYWMTFPTRRVFTHFRVEPAGRLWPPGIRVSLTTPMLHGLSYASDPGNPTAITEANQTGDYVDGLVFILLKSRYFPVNELGGLTKNERVQMNGAEFGCHARVYDGGAGVAVLPAVPAHVFAAYTWLLSDTPQTNLLPVADYRTLKVTCTITLDERVTAAYPPQPDDPLHDQASKHLINLGDDVRMDYMEDDTALGVDTDGALVKAATGGYLRNDYTYAQDVARLAYAWYRVERQAIRFELGYLGNQFYAGDMVESLDFGSEIININTLISSLTFDFDTQQTSINTDEAEELDFRALALK